MTPRPSSAASATSAGARRVVLVPSDSGRDTVVRRYRLARLRVADAAPQGAREARFEHLKRAHD